MSTMAWEATAQTVTLTPLGTFDAGVFTPEDPRISEINAFDPVGQRIYVVNPAGSRLDIINASIPASLTGAGSVNFVTDCAAAQGTGCPVAASEPNSVSIFGNILGVAVTNAVRTSNGHAVFYELQGAAAPRFLAALEVGAGPDMITFTEDGKFALTANEGEPNAAYTVDPKGSVSIIDVSRIGESNAVRTVFFDRYDNPGQSKQLKEDGVRIFGPGASPSQDLEPEYIATDNNKAYVTLQETTRWPSSTSRAPRWSRSSVSV
jgi:DNA-binding beta-propeller fold protein YncE